jgi:Methylene-tetrahydrofolate reductase C terminal
MRAARHWSVRHARGLESCYRIFERAFVALDPLWRSLGYARAERPVAAVERAVKGLLFDCRMCGQCILSSTGMSCPMNCPKELRNGPCGGVRANGHCEVDPSMRCVWVDAIAGSARMREGSKVHVVQFAVDRRLSGRSSWLAVARERQAANVATQAAAGASRRAPGS